MITNFIQLDFNKENDLKVPSVQYDSGSRFVKIKLQRNKSPFKIDGYRVTVVANKVDGTEIMNDCTILDGVNGVVQFEITEQFNAVEGVVDCQLKLFKGKTLLTSMPFSINVVKSVSTKEIVSSNELKTLVNALGEVQDIDNRFAQTNAQLSDNTKYLNTYMLDARIFGCKCDANYYNSTDKKWYVDNSCTILATDDSDNLQKAIDTCVTSTFIKIPSNICINKTVKLAQGVHLIGNSSFGFGAGFNETVIASNVELDRLFWFESDGITNSWHHSSISYLHLMGCDRVSIGIEINSPGECSDIKYISTNGFKSCGIKLTGELAPGKISHVSLNRSPYGLIVENGRHTLDIDCISGDHNTSLIYFDECNVSLGCVIKSIKSEQSEHGIYFNNCKGGTFTVIGGSLYPSETAEDCIYLNGFNTVRQRVTIIGCNIGGGFVNILKDGSKIIPNDINGQTGIITYNTDLICAATQNGFISTENGLKLRKYDGSFVDVITNNSSGDVFIKPQSSRGITFLDGRSNPVLKIGSNGVNEIIKPLIYNLTSKTENHDLTFNDSIVLCDATNNNIIISNHYTTLPTGYVVTIKKVDKSSNTVTFKSNNRTINGKEALIISSPAEHIRLVFDGNNWFTI